MKKILITLLIILTPLMAEQGFEQGTGKNESNACEAAKKKAYVSYKIFQMNNGCTCKMTETQEWMCDILFSYLSKQDKAYGK